MNNNPFIIKLFKNNLLIYSPTNIYVSRYWTKSCGEEKLRYVHRYLDLWFLHWCNFALRGDLAKSGDNFDGYN